MFQLLPMTGLFDEDAVSLVLAADFRKEDFEMCVNCHFVRIVCLVPFDTHFDELARLHSFQREVNHSVQLF